MNEQQKAIIDNWLTSMFSDDPRAVDLADERYALLAEQIGDNQLSVYTKERSALIFG